MPGFVAAMLLSIGLVWGLGAQAQTACPSGVGPGSAQCGPDSGTSRGYSEPPRPTGYWVKTWGAVAKSPSTGEAGNALGKHSEGEAREVAIRVCGQGGAKDCEVRLSFHNQCATVVTSDSETFYQSAVSEERAISLATKSCKESGGQCKVLWSACTEPIFIKY